MAYPDPPTTPPVPQRGDRTTFSARVDAFLTWIAAIIPWLQGFVADVKASLNSFSAGGANSFTYVFDSATADADPGVGKLRLGSATQNVATVLRLDDLTADNVSIVQFLAAITGGNSSVKGSVRIQKVKDPSAWILFDITSATGTGYRNLTVTPRASTGATPFVAGDMLSLFFDRNGDSGTVPGATELLGTIDVSSPVAAISALNIFNQNFDSYFCIYDNLILSPGTTLRVQLAVAGVVDSGTKYTTVLSNATATTTIGAAFVGVARQRCSGIFEIGGVNSAGDPKQFGMRGFYETPASTYAYESFGGQFGVVGATASVVTGFQVTPAVGAMINSGRIRIYGIRKV